MLNQLFQGVFDTSFTRVIDPKDFLLCVGTSLVIGLVLSVMAQWQTHSSESFGITLALLPAAVCVVIMMVNGNVGTGVAVAGAFSLVRFRSAAGSGREISAVFIAMGAGLMAGMGYLGYAILFTLILGGMMMACTALHWGQPGKLYRQLKITIPENLNYVDLFDPILNGYTRKYTLKQVKSTNMGSMFRLTYDITLREQRNEQELLNELRCMNGNLEISLSYQDSSDTSL